MAVDVPYRNIFPRFIIGNVDSKFKSQNKNFPNLLVYYFIVLMANSSLNIDGLERGFFMKCFGVFHEEINAFPIVNTKSKI